MEDANVLGADDKTYELKKCWAGMTGMALITCSAGRNVLTKKATKHMKVNVEAVVQADQDALYTAKKEHWSLTTVGDCGEASPF